MMLGASAAIAGNTVRELVRSKLFYNLLLFAVLFIGGSLFVAQLTIGNWARIILDMGLGAIEVAGAVMAIIIGVGLVAGEVERKTILPTLAKPVPRWAFFVGRYTGLTGLLAVNVGLMLLMLTLVLRLAGYGLNATAVEAALLIAVELAVLAAVALLFASFSTPILASAFGFSVFVIGHLVSDLQAFADKSKSEAARALARGFYFLLPDLELLNLKSHAANELPVAAAFVWRSAAYGLVYAAVMLLLAIVIFSRRDFN
ncbi:MAG TPA: ABC transporter permease [Myxococcales bacterium]|nr:ABC transporter permease [Myxococcales bacterium]